MIQCPQCEERFETDADFQKHAIAEHNRTGVRPKYYDPDEEKRAVESGQKDVNQTEEWKLGENERL